MPSAASGHGTTKTPNMNKRKIQLSGQRAAFGMFDTMHGTWTGGNDQYLFAIGFCHSKDGGNHSTGPVRISHQPGAFDIGIYPPMADFPHEGNLQHYLLSDLDDQVEYWFFMLYSGTSNGRHPSYWDSSYALEQKISSGDIFKDDDGVLPFRLKWSTPSTLVVEYVSITQWMKAYKSFLGGRKPWP